MAEFDPQSSLSIDRDVARRIKQFARRLDVSEGDLVRLAVEQLERAPQVSERSDVARAWLADFDRRHPPLEPREQAADKAFFDDLSGNL